MKANCSVQCDIHYHVVGEGTVVFYATGKSIEDKNAYCQAFTRTMLDLKTQVTWLLDIVPSFDSVTIHFNPLDVDQHDVYQWIRLNWSEERFETESSHLILPICYDLPKENDLQEIADHHDMPVEGVVNLHCTGIYNVYAIGFAPGFAYMGFVNQHIAMPRKKTPRKHIEKGAVAIADRQTAIYPSASPGGWNIVGYCPLNLVLNEIDWRNDVNTLIPFKVSQRVSFKRITTEEFNSLDGTNWCDYVAQQ